MDMIAGDNMEDCGAHRAAESPTKQCLDDNCAWPVFPLLKRRSASTVFRGGLAIGGVYHHLDLCYSTPPLGLASETLLRQASADDQVCCYS